MHVELAMDWAHPSSFIVASSRADLLSWSAPFFHFEELGFLTVKGLARPVKPLNVVRLRDPA